MIYKIYVTSRAQNNVSDQAVKKKSSNAINAITEQFITSPGDSSDEDADNKDAIYGVVGLCVK